MRVGITGDVHLDNMRGTYLVGGIPNREKDLDRQFRTMAKECVKRKVKMFVISGDLLNKSTVNGHFLKKVFRYIRWFTENNIEVVIIPGNHDATESGSAITEGLEEIEEENVKVINTIEQYKDFIFLPHEKREVFNHYDKYTDYVLDSIRDMKSTKIIGHFQPMGSVPGSEESMFAGSTRFLDISKFPSKTIFCSHVHRPQFMTPNCWIVGSPVRFDLGERNEEKRFVVYDTENEKVESIKLDCQKMKVINIDLTKKKLSLPADKLKAYANYILGIKVKVQKDKRSSIETKAIVDKFELYGAKVVSFKIDTEGSTSVKRTKKENMSPLSVFKRNVESGVKDETRIEAIMKLGKKELGETNDQSN